MTKSNLKQRTRQARAWSEENRVMIGRLAMRIETVELLLEKLFTEEQLTAALEEAGLTDKEDHGTTEEDADQEPGPGGEGDQGADDPGAAGPADPPDESPSE